MYLKISTAAPHVGSPLPARLSLSLCDGLLESLPRPGESVFALTALDQAGLERLLLDETVLAATRLRDELVAAGYSTHPADFLAGYARGEFADAGRREEEGCVRRYWSELPAWARYVLCRRYRVVERDDEPPQVELL